MSAPIRIIAAIATDARGRVLLVRKTGTSAFMEPSGKLEPGEDELAALARELREELGCSFAPGSSAHVGRRPAPAANEPGGGVEAELYQVILAGKPAPAAEIAEMIWMSSDATADIVPAPLTRDHVLPLIAAGRAR